MQNLIQVGDEIASRAFAGVNANILVIGIVGSKVIAGVLPDGDEEVRCTDSFELTAKSFRVERIDLAVPRLGGQFRVSA
jgi:hypothetical protein